MGQVKKEEELPIDDDYNLNRFGIIVRCLLWYYMDWIFEKQLDVNNF